MTPLFWITILYMIHTFLGEPRITFIMACLLWTWYILGI